MFKLKHSKRLNNGSKFEMTKENPKGFSVGYSKQLLAFANQHKMGANGMISKISTVSHLPSSQNLLDSLCFYLAF